MPAKSKEASQIRKIPKNAKRAIAKNRRNRGRLAMESSTQAEWAAKHDPLYRIGGKERHKKLKGMTKE